MVRFSSEAAKKGCTMKRPLCHLGRARLLGAVRKDSRLCWSGEKRGGESTLAACAPFFGGERGAV